MSQVEINEGGAPGDDIEAILGRAERASDPDVQRELLLEAARSYEAGAEPERAFLVRATAYRVRPDAHARAELLRLATVTGQLAELDALWAETMSLVAPIDRAAAWRDLGRLRLRKLRAPEAALAALEVALALEPGGEAAALRADALEELGRWRELDEALDEAAHAGSDDDRVRTLLRLADVRERHRGDAAGAEEACRRALAIDPTRVAPRTRLWRLVRGRGDAAAILALVDERLAEAPDDLAALHEAAELCEKLDRPADAARRYCELRERLPGDPGPLRALDRCYARLGRLRERTTVLEALVGLLDSERERAALHRQLAAAWTELGERPRAIESLEWLLMYEPSEATFEALAALYRSERRWAALADACTRQLRTAEAARKPALWRELAHLYEHELDDPGQAINCWQALVDVERDAEDALVALGRLYERIDACDRAVDCLERWAALGDARTRARRLGHVAELCASRGELPELGDRTVELFERALDADPRWLPARLALSASLRRRGEPARAAALLDGASEATLHPALLGERAAVCEAEGDLEGAFAALRALCERVPGHVDARRKACALGLQLGRHAEVVELAAALPDDGTVDERVERWLWQARAAHATGDGALATEALERAARLAPRRADVKRLAAERKLADGDVPAAEALVAELGADETAAATDRAQVAFLAGQCARARGDAAGALRGYHEALALDATLRPALRQLLDVTAELGRWHEALDVLDELVRLERDASLRARYRHLAGHICEEELDRRDEALMHYRGAMADDPDHPRAAERIAALLRAQGDFAGLAAHCARALERLGERGDVGRRAQLWNALADAAEGLGDRDGLTAALEVVVRLDASHWDARRKLAALYVEAGADAREQAIVAQHELLRLDKLHVPAYRALGRLYEQSGELARGAACLEAARLLSARDAEGPRPHDAAPPLPVRALGPADWARLAQPDEDRHVSLLSTLVAPLLAAAAAVPFDAARGWPGKPLARDATPPFVTALRLAAATLDVPTPEVFTRDDQLAPVRFANGRVGRAVRPALVVGLPLIGDRRRTAELLAPLALQTALLRPERMLRLLVADAGVLALLLRAAVSVAVGDAPAPELQVTAAALRRSLPPLGLDQLGVIGRRLRDEGRDLSRVAAGWLRAVDLTAARAALVVSGDLLRTVEAVQACALDPTTVRHAVGELIWASVTDEVWATRQALRSNAAVAGRGATGGVR